MKAKFFRKTFSGDEANRTLQTNIEDAIASTIRNPLLNGRLIENLNLASGSNVIEHKMGRKLRGYLVIKKSNASTIYNGSDDDKFLDLITSGALTVSLWVF